MLLLALGRIVVARRSNASSYIRPHEFADYLCGWLVIGLTRRKEFIAQFATNPDPHANVLLHGGKCNQWLHIWEGFSRLNSQHHEKHNFASYGRGSGSISLRPPNQRKVGRLDGYKERVAQKLHSLISMKWSGVLGAGTPAKSMGAGRAKSPREVDRRYDLMALKRVQYP